MVMVLFVTGAVEELKALGESKIITTIHPFIDMSNYEVVLWAHRGLLLLLMHS
jgi:hypothetical protein